MLHPEEELARVPFFSELGRRDLKRLAALCVPKEFRTGAELLEEGAIGLGLFLIGDGRVEVFKTEKGHRRRLAVLGAGEVLGEMALIDEKPRSASAVALEPTSALFLSRESFRTVVKKSPDVAWALVPNLAERLREAQDRLMDAELEAEEADARSEELEAEAHREEASDKESESASQVGNRLLRAQYAFLRSGVTGLSASVRAFESSLAAFADEVDLEAENDVTTFLGKVPRGFLAAATSCLDDVRGIPQEMADVFLQHLNGHDEPDGGE